MRAYSLYRMLLAVLVAGGGAVLAVGQTTTFLTPARFASTVDGNVAVNVNISTGTAVQRAAWPTSKVDWFFVRSAGVQSNRHDVRPAMANTDFVNVRLTKPGATLIGMDLTAHTDVVSGKELKAFAGRTAASESFRAITSRVADDDRVRVRRIESAKTLVRVADAGGTAPSHSAIAQSKSGQAVEIRPLADPTAVPVGSDLPLKIYAGGDKQAGVRVLATSTASGQVHEATTDKGGTCVFRITEAGVWRIEFHRFARPRRGSDADWEIQSATLTFEVPEAGEKK